VYEYSVWDIIYTVYLIHVFQHRIRLRDRQVNGQRVTAPPLELVRADHIVRTVPSVYEYIVYEYIVCTVPSVYGYIVYEYIVCTVPDPCIVSTVSTVSTVYV
jgi:hypothetical protein